MALPTVTKTWTFSVNNTQVNNGSIWHRREIWIQIKNWLKTKGWTVRGSCNASTAYNDGTDCWANQDSINFHYNGAYNKSWIVLRAPATFGATFDLMFSCANPNGNNWSGCSGAMKITTCQAGYNLNGTTQVFPTAIALEHSHVYYGSSYTYSVGMCLGRSDDSVYNYRVHYMDSSDGKNFRIFVCWNGYCQFMMLFERLDTVEAPAVWTEPCVLGVAAVGNTWHNINTITNNYDPFIAGSCQSQAGWQAGWFKCGHFRGIINSQQVYLYTTAEMIISDPLVVQWGVRNEITGKWPMYPVGVASGDVGRRGRHGMLTDMWMGMGGPTNVNAGNPFWGVAEGETYPGDGSRKFVQFGNMIFPWTGSAAVPVSTPCYVY